MGKFFWWAQIDYSDAEYYVRGKYYKPSNFSKQQYPRVSRSYVLRDTTRMDTQSSPDTILVLDFMLNGQTRVYIVLIKYIY